MPATPEVQKSQSVRLLDVLVLGPALLWIATRGRQLSGVERLVVGAIGAGTILYNLRNYLANVPEGETKALAAPAPPAAVEEPAPETDPEDFRRMASFEPGDAELN